MIETLTNITAVIGFCILCFLAYLGARVLLIGFKLSIDVFVSEAKYRRLKEAKTTEEAKAVLDQIEKKVENNV